MKPSQRPLQSDGRVHGVILGLPDTSGQWLMIRRSAHVTAPLRIAFPGGAVEVGESYEDAAVREAMEELNVEVELIDHVWDFSYSDKPLTLRGYYARIIGGTLRAHPHEVAEILWMTRTQIASHPDVLANSELFTAALETAATAHGQTACANQDR